MGYAYYELGGMRRGYGVSCKCHQRGCREKIDRGLSFLCYNCTWYFCSKHLSQAWCKTADEPIEVECFASEGSQVCLRCVAILEQWEAEHCEHEPAECGVLQPTA